MRPLDPLALPLAGTTLIEASAGTGKTHTITTLYVRLLLELGLSPGEILVVTYTNAATAELRTRIRRRLHEMLAALQGDGDDVLGQLADRRRREGREEQDRSRLIAALHAFDEAAISTIHGFCQRMLQEYAFESGAAFEAELIADAGQLLAEVVQDFWVDTLHCARNTLVQHLLDKRIGPQSWMRLALMAAAHPEMVVRPQRGESVRPVAEIAGDEMQVERVQLQLDLIDYVRRELPLRKARVGVRSFDDLLQGLAAALRSAAGGGLAALIRQRFRAALVDEFQDTDPIQYEIFRRLYRGSAAPVFLIGDPKQAIYAFRGADVFAYMQAKHDAADGIHTLSTNRRSDPSLVRAVRTLFERARAPFVFDGIPLLPVEPLATARDRLGGGAAGQPPLQLLFVPRSGKTGRGGPINKAWGERPLAEALAGEIVRLLESGATVADRPVTAGDIAVLCRTNDQAQRVQTALRAAGVPSVLQSDASVFATPEAAELERVLRAIAEPANARAIRAALATTLLGQSAAELCALEHDEAGWERWVQQFHHWHDLWLQRSVMAAGRVLLAQQRVAPRLLALLDGERRLTNVLHLLELVHTAGAEARGGPLALVQWLNRMRMDDAARAALAGEAAQIRLESDARAVQVTTVHKSKGLEYPIVYCPDLWNGTLLHGSDKTALRFHDSNRSNLLTLDLGSSEFHEHLQAAEREALAENLRLLYVALTRARHRCTLVWGPFRDAEHAALGYLLHQPPGDDANIAARTAERIKSFIASGHDEEMRADLAALVAAQPAGITVHDLGLDPVTRYTPAAEPAPVPHGRSATRTLSLSWRVASFTGLLAAEAAPLALAEAGADHDATATAAQPEPTAETGYEPVVLHDFPAGVQAGQLVHALLQETDFQVAQAPALRAQVNATLRRFGFDERWQEPLCRALGQVLATPLGKGRHRFRLCDVPLSRRLNELEFVFPAAGDAVNTNTTTVTASTLAAVFMRHRAPACTPAYGAQVRRLGFAPLAGYLRGFIDLVFEHRGRWYLVDYKSNHLGPRARDYAPPRLLAAMAQHHYFLQYHLYTVALHRYLCLRLPGYDYERHFGGVYYLFVRGMSPDRAGECGVFHDRPALALIEDLSQAGLGAVPARQLS